MQKKWLWLLSLLSIPWHWFDRGLSWIEHGVLLNDHAPWLATTMGTVRQVLTAPDWVGIYLMPTIGLIGLCALAYRSFFGKRRLVFPKWKYRVDPETKQYQCTLVGNADAEKDIGESWTDDPHEHGIRVVPLPAERRSDGKLIHIRERADANGNFAYGPAPTATGICEASIDPHEIAKSASQLTAAPQSGAIEFVFDSHCRWIAYDEGMPMRSTVGIGIRNGFGARLDDCQIQLQVFDLGNIHSHPGQSSPPQFVCAPFSLRPDEMKYAKLFEWTFQESNPAIRIAYFHERNNEWFVSPYNEILMPHHDYQLMLEILSSSAKSEKCLLSVKFDPKQNDWTAELMN